MTTGATSVADAINAEIKSLNAQIAEHEIQAIALREKVIGFEICNNREKLFPTQTRFMDRNFLHPGPDFEQVRGSNPHLARIHAAKVEWDARIAQLLADLATA